MDNESAQMTVSNEEVVKLYSDMVYRLAFARTRSPFEADEIFQEVFLRYIRKTPYFDSEDHRRYWFIRVTINCSKKLWHKSSREKLHFIEETSRFEDKAELNLLYALDKLPVKYREVVHLFYYEDMSLEDISRVLSRKPSTVRTQLTRARSLLRDMLKEDYYDI